MSIRELNDYIYSYIRVQQQETKLRVGQLFTLADLIANRVAFILDTSDNKDISELLQPWDIYADLFANEKADATEMRQNKELNDYKNARKAFAERLKVGG